MVSPKVVNRRNPNGCESHPVFLTDSLSLRKTFPTGGGVEGEESLGFRIRAGGACIYFQWCLPTPATSDTKLPGAQGMDRVRPARCQWQNVSNQEIEAEHALLPVHRDCLALHNHHLILLPSRRQSHLFTVSMPQMSTGIFKKDRESG